MDIRETCIIIMIAGALLLGFVLLVVGVIFAISVIAPILKAKRLEKKLISETKALTAAFDKLESASKELSTTFKELHETVKEAQK